MMKFLRHAPLLLLMLVIVTAATVAVHTPALAQQPETRRWSLRDLLFPRRDDRVVPPAAIGTPKPKVQKPRRTAPAEPAEPPAPVIEKAADARTVLVVGDFLASGLAEGLEAVFAENALIRIVDGANGSSGFVRDDFYDWRKEIGPLLEEENPVAVVVMMGSNDRQPIMIGDTREPPRSDAWTREYETRTSAFGKILAQHKLPFLWVGLPAFKSGKMSSDMLAFNDIYRAAAEESSGEFIDVWDGFADENGVFVTRGPDINGQVVRLRSDEGINMTNAGKRKLAFYAEKPLLKILGLSSPEDAAAPGGSPAILPDAPDGTPASLDRTPPMRLNDPALDGGTELLGAGLPATTANPVPPEDEPAETNGTPPAGRADDFSLAPKPDPAAPQAAKAGGTPDR